jgi:hypothetical protein
MARLQDPPAIRSRGGKYAPQTQQEYPEDVRPDAVLGHDLTLMRLGKVPDDETVRNALLVAVNRARKRRK